MVGRRLACRDAPRLASTSLNPRARHLTRENVCQRYVLAGQVTISAVTRRSRGLPGDLADRGARRRRAPDTETCTSHSRTTVGPPWSSGTQVVRTGEHRHEPAEQPSRARTLPGLGPRQLRPPRARPAPTRSAPPLGSSRVQVAPPSAPAGPLPRQLRCGGADEGRGGVRTPAGIWPGDSPAGARGPGRTRPPHARPTRTRVLAPGRGPARAR